ncbi:hypothetical protein OSB04_015385, partial [Centaurea solstitialis]
MLYNKNLHHYALQESVIVHLLARILQSYTLMASSSTSSIPNTSFKYDVFLSFRGEDTHKTFVDHLYDALKRQGIDTYKDDKNLNKGKKISTQLFQAIENSRFQVIVFSKDYVSSSWCLQELTKIMECQKMPTEHSVYPIFYHVEPTQVRKQSGEFGIAFSKHENDEAAEKWRKALAEASSFSGWELRTTNDGHEAEFIKLVVKEISLKLPSMIYESRGWEGSGKTTLARAVFDQICNEFEGSSFVENVRECSNSLLLGMKSLQQQVLRDVLNRPDITVTGVFDGKKLMKKYMPGRKALVVLDDVDDIYRAAQGFSRCAFQTESPILGYEELSKKVVHYAAGLPLTITVLGSSLCDTDKHVWIANLKKLKKIPLDEVQKKLELSYMGLDADCKAIFLDVACILKGWSKDQAIRVLESRGFHAIHGLDVLEKKSLVTTRDGCLDMHDRIEEMGRYIVRRLHPNEPNKHSRLWVTEEIEGILANNLGTAETECICLFTSSKMNQEVLMKGLEKMEKLRLLFLHIDDIYSNWKLDKVYQYFPNSIQYLKWSSYPFCSLPTTFQASDLVGLDMSGSKMEQLWEGGEKRVLEKLRFLDLSFSKLRSLDLGLAPNLEILNLKCCEDLVELDMQCLVKLDMPRYYPQLKYLNLSCPDLRYFNLGLIPKIEAFSSFIINRIIVCNPRLKPKECEDEFDMSLECPQLKSLKLYIPKLSILNLGPTPNLQTLKLKGSYSLVELHMHDERREGNVEALTLDGNDVLVEQFHVSNGDVKLESLAIERCSKLKTLDLRRTPNLESLCLEECSSLVEFHVPGGDVKLESLAIERCSKLKTLDLRRTPKLESLCLEGCSSLVKLHAPVGGVKRLNLKGHLSTKSVDVHTKRLYSSILKFEFECLYKEDLPSSIGNVEKLISEGLFCACIDLESFFGRICGLQCLTKLTLEGNISELPKDIDRLEHLKCLELRFCELLEKLPEDLGRLERLETLRLQGCIVLRDIPNSICRMKSLRFFVLHGCNMVEELPEELGQLECLGHLDITGTCINNLSQSILLLREQGLRISRPDNRTRPAATTNKDGQKIEDGVWNPFKSKLAAAVDNILM